MSGAVLKKEILKIYLDGMEKIVEDVLAVEKPLSIIFNNTITTLYVTPLHIKELATGFLLTRGELKDISGINFKILEKEDGIIVKVFLENVDFCKSENSLGADFLSERSVVCKRNFKIRKKDIFALFKSFEEHSELFKTTGCIHSSALAGEKEILFLAEDIHRYNAIDKVIGYAFLNSISLEDKLILVSCRISSEIISKIAKFRVPVIVSKSAPTSLAVKLAEKLGLTLIGFLRNERFNVYSHPYRVI
jgi:FdhD protein